MDIYPLEGQDKAGWVGAPVQGATGPVMKTMNAYTLGVIEAFKTAQGV